MTVEISVLSPDVVIHRPEEIEIGRHGLDVRRDGARGLLLPQVAVEHGFDRENFLAATCRKAGLPANAWHDDETEIRVFEAEVFGDSRTSRAADRGAPKRQPPGAPARRDGVDRNAPPRGVQSLRRWFVVCRIAAACSTHSGTQGRHSVPRDCLGCSAASRSPGRAPPSG